MDETAQPKMTKNSSNLNLRLDYRIIVVVLLLVIVGMLAMWRPWHTTATKDRTISVTGDATLRAEPDEFVFSPSYDFANSDKQAALAALTAKSNEIVAKLKSLGVPESGIKTNADNWSYGVYDNGQTTYTLRITVTIDNNKDLAQRVQDYLVTTSPTGEVTPSADFSESKRKGLESQARDQATKDARGKADQSAKNLGFKIAGVKSVDDSNGFGGIVYPMGIQNGANMATDTTKSLTVQPGQNDLSYSVSVTYYIK